MKPRKQLHESQEIAAQLGRGMPLLERVHGPPHAPEVGLEEMRREELVDALGTERPLAEREEPRKLESIALLEAELRHVDDVVLAIDEARPGVPDVRGAE